MICSICHLEIPLKKENPRYCFCCQIVFDKKCAKDKYFQCPVCGARVCDILWEPPHNLEAFIQDDASRTVYFEFQGTMPSSNVPLPNEQDVLSYVQKHIRFLRIGSFIGSFFLFIGGLIFVYFGFAVMSNFPISSTVNSYLVINPIPRNVVALVAIGVALMSFWLSVKSFSQALTGNNQKSPGEITERFYSVALNSEPLAISTLMDLLHPSTAWMLFQIPDYAEHLRDEWYRVRRQCRETISSQSDMPSPHIYKCEVSIGSQSDCQEVILATRYGMDIKRGGRNIFYFKNTLASVNGKWGIVAPFPGVMVRK